VRTREIADQAAAEGILPLEVMLRAMRLHAEAERWDQAAAIAKDAAPYIHPRLASTTLASDPERPLFPEIVDNRPSLNDLFAEFRAKSTTEMRD
jgi:hypothetical protein